MKLIHKSSKHGFTLIEITLFLALSGFLMVGIIIASNISISRQRYNDAVNSFADFLRGIYSEVSNVSNDSTNNSNGFNGGRSTTAIYGKLVTFGEKDDINSIDKPGKTIYVYDVGGVAVSSSSVSGSSVLEIMKNPVANGGVSANIYHRNCGSAANCPYTFYSMTTYHIPWESNLEKVGSVDCNHDDTSCRFSGAVLVVRSPVTGSMRTYVYDGSIIEDMHSYGNLDFANTTGFERFRTLMTYMEEKDLDFCLDSEDNRSDNRRNIRILAGANNSSGIYIAELDSAYDDETNPNGSKCFGR